MMNDETLLFQAREGVQRIDRLNGHLLIPVDDHEAQAMAQAAGYELIDRNDERYGLALRRAYDAICNQETTIQQEN